MKDREAGTKVASLQWRKRKGSVYVCVCVRVCVFLHVSSTYSSCEYLDQSVPELDLWQDL